MCRIVRWITYVVLASGAAYTIGLILWAAQWNTELIQWLLVAGFAIWATGPYVALGVLNALSRSRASLVILLVASLLCVGGGLPVYYDAFFVNLDALSGLVFILVPLYQWGATVLLAVVWAVIEARRAFSKRKSPEGSPPGS